MSIVEEIRAIADKTNRENRLRAEEERKISEEAAKEESTVVYGQIMSIVRCAASEGKYFVDIHNLVVDINGLSARGLQSCLDRLRAEGLRAELDWITDNPFIGSPCPGSHDIEGWEEYDRKVAEGSRRFIGKIHVSWNT